MSSVLGLDHSFPWPPRGSDPEKSVLWPRIFFEFLALASNVVSSTPRLAIGYLKHFCGLKIVEHLVNLPIIILKNSVLGP